MTKKIFIALAALALVMPLYPQDKGAEKKEKKPDDKIVVWQEVALEDFETTPYTDKDVSYSHSSDQEANLSIRTDAPATAASKKYLGLKIRTRGSDTFVIRPPRDIVLENYCKAISIWVYGENTHGEISIMIQDVNETNHRLVMVPVINFLGWKQFTVLLTDKIYQGNVFQTRKKTIKLMNIQYRTTMATGKTSGLEYVYLDDITATVKEHKGSKQNDQW